MRDDDHRHPLLPAHVLKQLEDCLTGLVIKCTCRLITKEKLRILCKGSRYGNTLLFATGKLCGEIPHSILKADFSEDLCRIQRILADLHGKFYIFQCCQVRNQIIKLEYKTDVITAICRKLSAAIICDISAIYQNLSLRCSIHAAENIQNSRLAGPTRSYNDYKFTFGNLKTDLIDCTDFDFTHLVYFGNFI